MNRMAEALMAMAMKWRMRLFDEAIIEMYAYVCMCTMCMLYYVYVVC